MKGREGKGAQPTDLFVCFPSRAHLTLMPKPICSPARPTEQTKRHRHHHQHHHLLARTNNRGGQASPLLWAKTKSNIGSEVTEPTSPKVTCAGQIKVRSKPSSCKNWQSVMEEIEKLHNGRKAKKRSSWSESLGFKKDIMQFLTCLRNIRFNLGCFGSFHGSDITSDDQEGEEDEEEDHHEKRENKVGLECSSDDQSGASRTIFSKWFMVLQENQNNGLSKEREDRNGSCDVGSSAPPSNALLLMRCRSAPAKSWIEEKEQEEAEKKAKLVLALEEEKKKNKNDSNLVLMKYAPADFYRVSCDIAKESWVVGGIRDPLSRSRSWKR